MKQFLFVIWLFLPYYLFSEPVDSIEAKQIAMNYYMHLNPNKSYVSIKKTMIKQHKGIDTRYTIVFDNLDFVIVSADNSTVPIFAYSNENSFRETDIPLSFEFWLQTEYDELVCYVKANNIGNENTIGKWNDIKEKNFDMSKSTQSVFSLITTHWGQSHTNDGFCPGYNIFVDEKDTCGCDHCTAGCVAVAMSQIMKFWQSSSSDFDWCNMPNDLIQRDPSLPFPHIRPEYETERDAIAELIADCGDKAEMDYCRIIDDEETCNSGTSIGKARQALQNDYSYSNDMLHRYRASTINWKSKMRNSLDDGQPILYGGNKPSGELFEQGNGHAFVCDGYEGEDYFHFNWGGNGSNDGYFYIDDDDGSPVIDYKKWQEAIFYLHPESSSTYCVDCNESINISNWVNYNNPYNSDFPLIQWSGIPIGYNLYLSSDYIPTIETKPIYSEIITENGETRLEYNDIKAGVINVDNVVIPDKVNVHLKAYDSIVLTNFSTEEGAEFTAEIIPCPNTSGNKSINTENEIIKVKDNINTLKEGFKIFPNPCSYETTITYSTNENEKFEISIYNIYGQKIQSLIKGIQNEGIYNLIFKTTELENGVYICVFSSEQRIEEIKFVKNE